MHAFTSSLSQSFNISLHFAPIQSLTHNSLFPEELSTYQKLGPNRASQFKAGRSLIHQAFQSLGYTPSPIPSGPNGQPLWPTHLHGSLSHSKSLVATILTPNPNLHIGLDIEESFRLKHSLWEKIFTPSEIAFLSSLPIHDQPLIATTLFSAKESFYKAQFPITRSYLGFLDASLSLNISNQSFSITLLNSPPALHPFSHKGFYTHHLDHVWTVSILQKST